MKRKNDFIVIYLIKQYIQLIYKIFNNQGSNGLCFGPNRKPRFFPVFTVFTVFTVFKVL